MCVQNVLYEFMGYFHSKEQNIWTFAFDFYFLCDCYYECSFFSYVSNDTNDDNIKKYQLRSFTNFNPNLNIAYDFWIDYDELK